MMLSQEEVRDGWVIFSNWKRVPTCGRIRAEQEFDEMIANYGENLAARIADDMDFWNSIHDGDNQADSDWIRQRYGASE